MSPNAGLPLTLPFTIGGDNMANAANAKSAPGVPGSDIQSAQLDTLARQYPNSADALPGMQRPDMPGGPVGNALAGYLQIHYSVPRLPVDPTTLGLPAYGTIRDASSPQIFPQE